MECPLKSNGGKDICVTFTHRKWRRVCVTFTQRYGRGHTGYFCDIQTKKSGTVPLGKRGKKVWQSIQNKGNVWNKRKQGGL